MPEPPDRQEWEYRAVYADGVPAAIIQCSTNRKYVENHMARLVGTTMAAEHGPLRMQRRIIPQWENVPDA